MSDNVSQLDVYRRMTAAQRVVAGCGLHDFAHARLVAHMSRLHPEKSRREVLIVVARRLLGDAAGIL